jgi:uncharacterized protein YdhG (YjbR/CyaY superfamily)
VIAAGFVFALNQGDEATVSNASTRAAEIQAARHAERVEQLEAAYEASIRPEGAAELERLNELALQVRAQHPAFNIEKTKMELAGQLVVEHPGVNPEKTRMDNMAEKLGEVVYVPSILQPVEDGTIRNGFVVTNQGGSYWSEGNLDLIRGQAKAQQPTELNQPEWDNRMP